MPQTAEEMTFRSFPGFSPISPIFPTTPTLFPTRFALLTIFVPFADKGGSADALLIGMLAVFAGCFNEPVLLRQPRTGKTVKRCPTYVTCAVNNESTIVRERGCVEDYQRQGYERVME